jgi:hypothetical protein
LFRIVVISALGGAKALAVQGSGKEGLDRADYFICGAG